MEVRPSGLYARDACVLTVSRWRKPLGAVIATICLLIITSSILPTLQKARKNGTPLPIGYRTERPSNFSQIASLVTWLETSKEERVNHVLVLLERGFDYVMFLTLDGDEFIDVSFGDPLPSGYVFEDLRMMWHESEFELLRKELESDAEFYIFGDFVWCHRGVDLATAPDGLVLGYMRPEAAAALDDRVLVLRKDCRQILMSEQGWQGERAHQGDLRRAMGLSGLPWGGELPSTLEEAYAGFSR